MVNLLAAAKARSAVSAELVNPKDKLALEDTKVPLRASNDSATPREGPATLSSFWQSSLGRAAAAGCGASTGKSREVGRAAAHGTLADVSREGDNGRKAGAGRRSPRAGSRSAAKGRRRRSRSHSNCRDAERPTKAARSSVPSSCGGTGRDLGGGVRRRRSAAGSARRAGDAAELTAGARGSGSGVQLSAERHRVVDDGIREVLEAARRQLTAMTQSTSPERPKTRSAEVGDSPRARSTSSYTRLLGRGSGTLERRRRGRRRSRASSATGGKCHGRPSRRHVRRKEARSPSSAGRPSGPRARGR